MKRKGRGGAPERNWGEEVKTNKHWCKVPWRKDAGEFFSDCGR